MESVGHRVKRMKTENSTTVETVSRLGGKQRATRSRSARSNEKVATEGVATDGAERVPSSSSVTTPLSQAKSSSFQGSVHIDTVEMKSTSDTSQNLSHLEAGAASPEPAEAMNIDIDFSAAPSDPLYLAFWVARQIRQYAVLDGSGSDNTSGRDDSRSGRSSQSHPPGRPICEKTDRRAGTATVAYRDKRRDDNRKRKQSWRNTHLERNKDNDLRCRINTKANKLFGSQPSSAKTEFQESEFVKRREKRERRASNGAHLPSFGLEANLGSRLFPNDGIHGSSETNAVGTLFLNTLGGIRNAGVKNSNREAAAALKAALEDASTNPKPFVQALRTLGADQEVMSVINATLKACAGSASHVSLIGSNSAQDLVAPEWSAANGRETAAVALKEDKGRGGVGNSPALERKVKPKNSLIKILEQATNILSDMAEGNRNTYVTPYGNPPTANDRDGRTMSNGVVTQGGGVLGVKDAVEPKQAVAAPSLGKSDIDDFLKLAAGGSVSDDDDDVMSDASDDDIGPPSGQTPAPQLDSDVGATLQRIINELMTERQGGQNSLYVDDRRGLSINTSQTGFYGTATAKDQAANLKRLFAQAGVSINTIIPAAQSHATSQLYAHLSSRANRFPTSGGGINPSHASAYGNTAQMTQRMLERPGNSFQPLQPAPSTSRGNVVGPPVRARNAEELRKIQDYGFPPLPGSRPGQKRKL